MEHEKAFPFRFVLVPSKHLEKKINRELNTPFLIHVYGQSKKLFFLFKRINFGMKYAFGVP